MPTALYIDDSPPLLRTVQRQLERRGWTVHTTDYVSERVYAPDVILADWHPHGPDVLARYAGRVPVVVYSGSVDAEEALELGAVDVLHKPATSEQLDQTLKSHLKEDAS